MKLEQSLEKSAVQRPVPLERVVRAAIVYRGERFESLNHALALREMEKKYPEWRADAKTFIEEGFVTSNDRFVSREEAARIADQAGQVTEEDRDSRWRPGELDSSELRH